MLAISQEQAKSIGPTYLACCFPYIADLRNREEGYITTTAQIEVEPYWVHLQHHIAYVLLSMLFVGVVLGRASSLVAFQSIDYAKYQ